MNGPLFCMSLLVAGLSWLSFYGADHKAAPDKKHAWERTGAALAGFATFGAMLALASVFAQVWTDASEGVGLFILIVVLVAAGVFGYFAIARGWKHHRHSTLALGVVLGGAVALVYGGFQAIRENAGKYLTSAGHGITTAAGNTGTAHAHTHGHAASSSGEWGIVLILAAAVILGLIIVRRHRRGEVVNVGGDRHALPAGDRRQVGGGSRHTGGGRPSAGVPLFAGGDGS